MLLASLLSQRLALVVLYGFKHAFGVLLALLLGLGLLLLLLLLALLFLLLLVLLITLLLLVLLLLFLVFVLVASLLLLLVLLLVLVLLVVAIALLLLLLLLGLLQQSACIGQVVSSVFVLGVQLQGVLVGFYSLLEVLHALLFVLQARLHHAVAGIVKGFCTAVVVHVGSCEGLGVVHGGFVVFDFGFLFPHRVNEHLIHSQQHVFIRPEILLQKDLSFLCVFIQ